MLCAWEVWILQDSQVGFVFSPFWGSKPDISFHGTVAGHGVLGVRCPETVIARQVVAQHLLQTLFFLRLSAVENDILACNYSLHLYSALL